ncbi:MAG: bifunctional folylpolyglutamate synthase/dihydrofolate synthase, partial [Rikenellaceae bacterium]|nr:bifunctional folylpolyglutamate synthase/dihydrofolate synthase [Rikenellaceae bacterium]
DSTNIITPLLSVITNISLDHTQFLGTTRAAIAVEKAGIIKPGIPVVVGETDPETAPVFIAESREMQSRLLFADQCYRILSATPAAGGQRLVVENRMDDYAFGVDIDLSGRYQRKNILTVIAALDVLQESGALRFTRSQVEDGLRRAAATTGLMGRWQILGRDPLIICDTGHNSAGMEEVAAQLRNYDCERLFIVFGAVRDKDLDAIFPHLPAEAHYLFTQAAVDRALPAEVLAARARQAGLKGETVPTVKEALAQALAQAAPRDLIFIGGSTFIVAEII